MSYFHSPRIVTEGLVLALDAANAKSYPGSGTTWTDLSGNGNNGTLTNGPTFDSANLGSLVFDGVDDSSTINTNLVGLTGITVNVWYFSNTGGSTALTREPGNAFILHFRGAGFYIRDSNSNVSGYLGWNPQPTGFNWRMLTGTWDGNTMKLYQNGVKQQNELSFIGTSVLRTINTINLGFNFNTSQPWTNGRISNFKIYNRALTSEEVLQNYNATKGRFNL